MSQVHNQGHNRRENVLITGASSGIGAATASLLSREGYRVWGTTRDLSKLAKLPDGLVRAVRFVEMDVADAESVKRGVAMVMEEAGEIDVLINNAGFGIYGPIEEVPVELVKAQFETNVFGVIRVIQEVVPSMRERRSGLVINISSLASTIVVPFQVHYGASKRAIEAFTEGLRQELRPFGVKVVAIEPAYINTNFNNATRFGHREDSPYGSWLEASWRSIDRKLRESPPPSVVARKILRIIRDPNPPGRSPCGAFTYSLIPFVARFVPDGLREYLVRTFYGINFSA